MTDVSSLVNHVLKGREAPRIGHYSYSFEQINGFLQDAYTIVCYTLIDTASQTDGLHSHRTTASLN